jgi:hypothetical protein
MPLRPSRLPDSGHIFTSSNGLRMRKISHSVRKPKQAKKMGDCTVRTVPRGRLTVQAVHHTTDVAAPGEDTWQVTGSTTGDLDQSEGDTCHHCKGDTWHRLTVAGTVACWHGGTVADWADTSADRWMNQCLTSGSF